MVEHVKTTSKPVPTLVRVNSAMILKLQYRISIYNKQYNQNRLERRGIR